jgi:hypothetical protein
MRGVLGFGAYLPDLDVGQLRAIGDAVERKRRRAQDRGENARQPHGRVACGQLSR